MPKMPCCATCAEFNLECPGDSAYCADRSVFVDPEPPFLALTTAAVSYAMHPSGESFAEFVAAATAYRSNLLDNLTTEGVSA